MDESAAATLVQVLIAIHIKATVVNILSGIEKIAARGDGINQPALKAGRFSLSKLFSA